MYHDGGETQIMRTLDAFSNLTRNCVKLLGMEGEKRVGCIQQFIFINVQLHLTVLCAGVSNILFHFVRKSRQTFQSKQTLSRNGIIDTTCGILAYYPYCTWWLQLIINVSFQIVFSSL